MNNLSLQDVEVMTLAIPLEKNFNRHDEYGGKRAEPVDEALEINIGCSVSPKMIKIGKNASPKESKAIENLIREYTDVLLGLMTISRLLIMPSLSILSL